MRASSGHTKHSHHPNRVLKGSETGKILMYTCVRRQEMKDVVIKKEEKKSGSQNKGVNKQSSNCED